VNPVDSNGGELLGRIDMEELFNLSGLPPGGRLVRQLPLSGEHWPVLAAAGR
jgi:hypothetical protein